MHKKTIFKIILILFALLTPFLIGELALLIHHNHKFKTGLGSPYSLEGHFEWGWTPKPLFKLSYPAVDMAGNTFQVNYETDVRGFRLFGAPKSQKKKILFIGDSFTHSRDIDANQTFYGLFKEEYEVFAFGSSGYGTWQEYLVLEMYLNEIKPDLVVWQHHVNDFFDNLYELDMRLGFSGFLFNRPYPGTTRLNKNPNLKLINKFSGTRLGHYLATKYILWTFSVKDSNVFEDLKSDPLLEKSLKNFQKSIDISYGLSPKTKFMHFFVTHDQWFEKRLREKVKFKFFVNEFSKYINNSKDISVDQMGHWNAKGHQQVQKFLAPLIRTQLNQL